MRVPEVLDGRYQITDEIGRGGMGAVFRALDRKTAQYVAIKVMLDASNQEFLALFDKEWRILAGLQHTNIIGLSDRGEFQDGPAKYPYFVMPYLRGKTLHEWIHSGNGASSVAEVVAVISAAAAGLQAAHNRGLVHRDVKPSNIFILESGSVVVIDFGIVHLGDSRTGTTLKGTTPYIAPELLDPDKNDKPSPQSDVFSLGVVCYEALTGIQPFSRATLTDTIRAILKDVPKPAYEVNRHVSLLVGQVVQKSMAKNKNHRFKTVSEFADQLQRASRNEELSQFGRHVIEDKVRVVREAIAQGLITQAHKMLRDVEDEGFIDPSITAQREKIDQLMQQKWIRSELESARIYRSNEEYATAMEKVSEVLEVVPDNAEALAELHLIRQKRLGKALGDARQHIDKHEFEEARRWIEEARQINALDTQTSDLLAELNRREEADHELAEQKETLYQEAQAAYRSGYLPGALRRLERIVELIHKSGGIRQSHRDSIFLRFYEEVRQEYARLNETWERARTNLTDGNFAEAVKDCNEILLTNPGESRLEALRLQAESKQRDLRLSYVQQILAQCSGLDNLDDRVALIQDAVAAYPGESQLQELLANARASRDLMNGLLAKARLAEDSDRFAEALEQLQTAESLHPVHPGIRSGIARIERRLDDQVRAQRKAEFTDEIWRRLRNAEYERAARICMDALEVFPADNDLFSLQADVHERLKRGAEAKSLLQNSRELLHEGKAQDALSLLRRAYGIDRNDRQVRQFLGIALVAAAESVLQSNVPAAEQLFKEAWPLIPNDPALKNLSAQIADRRQWEIVEAALTRARHLALSGDLRGAVREIDGPLKHFPNDRRLVAERAEILQNLGEHIPTPTPVKQPTPKTPVGEEAAAAAAAPRGVSFDSLFARPGAVPPLAEHASKAGAQKAARALEKRKPSFAWKEIFLAFLARVRKLVLIRAGLPALVKSRRFQAIAAGLVGGILIVVLSWGAYRAFTGKPASPKPPTLITMSLISNPPAPISVDGKVAGSSPVTVHLHTGSHTIASSLPGYRPQFIPVQVNRQTGNLTIKLEPLPLRLQVITDQLKARVSLDDQMIGTTASDGTLAATILPGTHLLKVEGSTTSKVSFHFVPGELAATSELPADATSTVFFFAGFNGKALSQCSCRLSTVKIGAQHADLDSGDWKLDLAGGEYPVTLDVFGGRKLSVAVTQEPSATLAIFTPGRTAIREPESPDVLVSKAESLYGQGDYRDADDLVKQALSRDPNHEGANSLKKQLDRMESVLPFRRR